MSAGADGELRTPGELIRRTLARVRRRWLTALVLFALTIAGALAVTLGKPAQYTATAQILLAPSDAVGQLVNPGSLPSPANAQRDVDTNAKLITSHPVLDRVRAELGLRSSDAELSGKVEVSGQADSSLVSIAVTDSSPLAARRLAGALARQYMSFRRQSARDAVRQAIAGARARLDELPRTSAARAQRAAVRSRLATLEANAAIATGGVQIVALPGAANGDRGPTATAPPSASEALADGPARRALATPAAAGASPTDPAPRRVKLTLLMAAFVGALLAVAGACAMDALDRRLLSAADVEAAFGVPVVGCLSGRMRASGRDGDPSVVAAVADLTTSLGFTAAGGPRTLMISPVGRGVGNSGLAARLATQLAALRRRVIVIDANLAGAASDDDGGSGCGGLADILARDSSLDDEISVVHVVPARQADPGSKATEVISYELLASGAPVSNPAALLGRPALAATVRCALARADVVLLDAGAPAPVSQSAPLAACSDRIVLLAQLRRTTDADAVAARRALGPRYDRVAGVVVLTADRPPLIGRERVVAAGPPLPDEPAGDAAAVNGSRRHDVWPPAGTERERV